jgi:hypothetical protein
MSFVKLIKFSRASSRVKWEARENFINLSRRESLKSYVFSARLKGLKSKGTAFQSKHQTQLWTKIFVTW